MQFAYAKAADGIKGGPAADLKCTGCVSVAEIKWDGAVNMAGQALTAGKITSAGDIVAGGVVAGKEFVGDGSKLTGIKVPAGSCPANQAVIGIANDGSLKCASSGLAPDNLDEVSNNLLTNQFTDTIPGAAMDITDNNPSGVLSTINFPDIGIAQDIQVNVNIENSEIGELTVFLFPPNAPVLPADRKDLVTNYPASPTIDGTKYPHYLLHRKTGSKGAKIVTTFPAKTKPVAGDIHKDWIGKNPKGQWRLLVVDSKYLNNQKDGKVVSWSISLKTLSNKKVGVQGNAYVGGTLWGTDNGHGKAGGAVEIGGGVRFQSHAVCDLAHRGTFRNDPIKGFQVCQINEDLSGNVTYEWYAAKAQPVMFSGGCLEHCRKNSNWCTYCLDGSDFNTAQDYVDVNPNGTIYIKKSGYYRLNYFGINHSANWQHVKIVKNGWNFIHHGHNHAAHGTWHDNFADIVWPFKKGEWVRVDLFTSGASYYNYHHYNFGGDINGKYAGAYSRLQFSYEGPLKGAGTFRPETAPATCKEILDNWPGSKDGIYYIDPDGKGGAAPKPVYCDMTTEGGGWTLVNYCPMRTNRSGFPHGVAHAMYEMQCGDGSWHPDSRDSCASIRAVEIAHKSKDILFARGADGTNGNILSYDVATSFPLPDPKAVNFSNPNKYGLAVGTGADQRGACVSVKLHVVKGDKQYEGALRYTYKHAIGLTWSDGHPTQLGATQDTNCEGPSGMSQGPSFVSVHTGNNQKDDSHKWYTVSCKHGGKTYKPVIYGRPNYHHNYWWDPAGWSKHGAASIWLR